MALADSVPGVSGGTIAFLMGFYDAFVGSLDAVVHGTKQERLLGLLYLLKLAAGWVVGMALAVTVLAGAFTDGIYQLSSLFLGFVLVSIPLVMREKRAVLGTFRQNWLPFLAGIVLVVCLSALRLPRWSTTLVSAQEWRCTRLRPERWRSRQWCCRASPVRLC